MSHSRKLRSTRIDWKNMRQFGWFLGLLWGLTVLGTFVGLLVQALIGARTWSDVPSDMVPVLLGTSLGYGLLWLGSNIATRRRKHPPE
ncbi:hypothetical protein SAMN06295974_1664 [Plantibacter flavus]|uniref:Uncharacterized protein n=1 Tax=Plantibacter flavus TaxID=150123 RepID=A0A3N2C7U2_9MICO|nr:hypothetical protein [Plantibacter flavus]ROR83593.1 hypothetical protein EDD42_3707 [Plantibacter flavus]SMG25144.1 hypothetical protein SAMN06295974_1664 [Plantibacter flavus]